jgi:hypothetical protein
VSSMKVFISWSGQRSKAVAEALRTFLKDVIQAVEPFMSKHDIVAGSLWSETLSQELAGTDFGILCLTPENLNAAWLLFEAGALSKKVGKAFVCPYLIGVENSNVEWPLAQFQTNPANEEGTFSILQGINKAGEKVLLETGALERAFRRCYPDLRKVLENLPAPAEPVAPQRDVRDILDEILETVRQFNGPTISAGARRRAVALKIHFVGGSRSGLTLAGTSHGIVSRILTADSIFAFSREAHMGAALRILTVAGEQAFGQRPLSIDQVREMSEIYQIWNKSKSSTFNRVTLQHTSGEDFTKEYNDQLVSDLYYALYPARRGSPGIAGPQT